MTNLDRTRDLLARAEALSEDIVTAETEEVLFCNSGEASAIIVHRLYDDLEHMERKTLKLSQVKPL